MGAIELIIIGMVVFGVWQFVRKQTSESTRDLSHGAVTGVFVLLGVLALLGVLVVGVLFTIRFASYQEQAPVVSHAAKNSSEVTATAPLAGNDQLVSLQDYEAASAAPVHQSAQGLKFPITFMLVIVGSVLVFFLGAVIITAIKGSSVARYSLIGLGCLFIGLMFFGTLVKHERNMAHLESARRMDLMQQNRAIAESLQAQREAELKTMEAELGKNSKPPIEVDTSKSGDKTPIDINKPTKVVDIHYTTSGKDIETSETLPQWLGESTIDDRDRLRTVISSDRFATPEEALNSIMPHVRHEVIFRVLRANNLGMGTWTTNSDDVTFEQLTGTVVKRRCDIAFPLQVGGFEEEVYEVYLEIDLDAESREALYAKWRPTQVNKRLTYLGIAAGSITLLLGAGAFMTRRKVA